MQGRYHSRRVRKGQEMSEWGGKGKRAEQSSAGPRTEGPGTPQVGGQRRVSGNNQPDRRTRVSFVMEARERF